MPRTLVHHSITGCTISADEAREYETSRRSLLAVTGTETDTRIPAPPTDEQRVLTFAELQELIETGRVDQIPNNKAIPDALNVSFQIFLSFWLIANVTRAAGCCPQRVYCVNTKETLGDELCLISLAL